MMERQKALAAFAQKFRTQDLYLAQVGGWDIALRPGQLTLGSMIVSVRSGALHFADLNSSEHADMGAAFTLAEKLATVGFGATRINLLCLMMQDPIVHFHVLPRYSAVQEKFGQTWIDADWPGPPYVKPIDTEERALQRIRRALLQVL